VAISVNTVGLNYAILLSHIDRRSLGYEGLATRLPVYFWAKIFV
jgi:hypothetical protein